MPDFLIFVIDHDRFKKRINGATQIGQSIQPALIICGRIIGHSDNRLVQLLLFRRGSTICIHLVVIMFGLRAYAIGAHIGGL